MMNVIIALVVGAVLWSAWGYYGSHVPQAEYSVVKKMDSYEIREYPSHIVAQTALKGSFDESLGSGFSIVAGYIFGGNVKKESIAMTAPVVAQKIDSSSAGETIAMTAPVLATTEGDSQIISFGMPKSYTLETLPKPNDSRIKVLMIPAKKYAAMRFSWYSSEKRVKETQEKLRAALVHDGFVAEGGYAYAGYNAPWTPPWMMRNEVLIQVK
ncbi:MAG: heme-binding protein [bacterium]